MLDVYLAREDADPEVTGRAGRRRRTAAVRAGHVRAATSPTCPAVLADRARRRRPGAHPRRRQHHRGRPAGPGAARGARACVAAPAPPTPPAPRRRSTRPRPAAAGGSRAGSGRDAGWPGGTSSRSSWSWCWSSARSGSCSSRPCSPSTASRCAAPATLDAARRAGGRRRTDRRAAGPGRPRRDPGPGRGARRRPVRRRHPAVARRGADRDRGTGRGRRGRPRRRGPRHGQGRRGLPRVPPAPPPRLPRVQTSADTGSDALREAAAVIAALPPDLAGRVDHVEVETVDRITLVLRDGRTVMWGSADESTEKATVLAAAAAAGGAQATTCPCPAGRRRPTEPAPTDPARIPRRAWRVATIHRPRLPTVLCNARLT